MKILASLLLFTLIQMNVLAQDAAPARRQHFNLDNGLAISGYDAVAYFKQNKAVKGKKEFALNHQGATYLFASAANKETFKQNPTAYEPQYGGWCAYAMSKGEKVPVDPETFKITNNKLYLFYNKFFNNTLKSWNEDENRYRASADKYWNGIIH